MTNNVKSKNFPALIATISEDRLTAGINRGKDANLKIGDEFLIYRLSNEDIIDPETNENLGKWEIVLGRGKVTNIQEKITTISSSEYIIVESGSRTVETKSPYNLPKFLYNSNEKVTYKEPKKEPKPFDDVKIGDFVKPI